MVSVSRSLLISHPSFFAPSANLFSFSSTQQCWRYSEIVFWESISFLFSLRKPVKLVQPETKRVRERMGHQRKTKGPKGRNRQGKEKDRNKGRNANCKRNAPREVKLILCKACVGLWIYGGRFVTNYYVPRLWVKPRFLLSCLFHTRSIPKCGIMYDFSALLTLWKFQIKLYSWLSGLLNE